MKNYLTYDEKKFLYERIMEEVSKTVKKKINEAKIVSFYQYDSFSIESMSAYFAADLIKIVKILQQNHPECSKDIPMQRIKELLNNQEKANDFFVKVLEYLEKNK